MYDPPAYIWAITTAGTAAIAAATCVVLYSGAKRAGLAGGARRCWPGPRPPCSAAGSPPPR